MAPQKSSARTTSSPALKQGTLSFTSSKRNASTATVGKLKKTTRTAVSPSSGSKSNSRSSSGHSHDEDSEDTLKSTNSEKRGPAMRATKRLRVSDYSGMNEKEDTAEQATRPSLDPNDLKWYQVHSDAKKRMDYVTPIHAKERDQNKIHEILRVFDLSYEYGPCIGVSRIDRWERAEALGLNPPSEIREILSTLEGTEKPEFSQCVFFDEV